MLTGPFTLVMADGEIETNYKDTLYSSYVWDLHREFPGCPLLLSHHLRTILGNKSLKADTHAKLLTNVFWSIYEHYARNIGDEESRWKLRKHLRRRAAEIYNHIYNDLTYRLGEYVTSLDILDFIEVHEHPKVNQALMSVNQTQLSIDKTYSILNKTLMDPEELPHNSISKIMRAGIANAGQINQCLGPRGFLTDTDSNIFKEPILVSYLRGLHNLHDSLIESRTASKSLTFSKEPLQQAEYLSRRIQLLEQVVQNLHMEDCGSKHYISWRVRGPRRDNHGNKIEGDLANIRGIWYLKEDGSEDWIRGDEEHLVGQTIKMRNPVYCQHPDRYGVCAKCFGMLSFSLFKGCNLGQYAWTFVAAKSSQSVLSVKHYDGSSVVDKIYIADNLKKFLNVTASGTSYLFSDQLKDKKNIVRLIVSPSDAEGMNDINKVDDVRKLNLSRVSEITEIGIEIINDVESVIESIPVGMRARRASFTYPFLKYIKETGYKVNSQNNFVIDLAGWNWEEPFMVLPLKHFDMSAHSQLMAKMLESTVGQFKIRDTETSIDAFLTEFYDLINSKLSINLAIVSVVVYGSMVVSAVDNNYSLPKPYTDSGLGVMRLIMNRRSLAGLLAYQGQKEAIIDPINYLGRNRVNHPFDDIFVPELLNKK